jgi:hypothetical protein
MCIMRKTLNVVNEQKRVDASSIAIPLQIFNTSNEIHIINIDLAYIYAIFSFLLQSITKLEKTKHVLSTAKKLMK